MRSLVCISNVQQGEAQLYSSFRSYRVLLGQIAASLVLPLVCVLVRRKPRTIQTVP